MYSHTFTFDDGKPFTTGCTAVVTATLEGKELGPYDILIDIIVAQNIPGRWNFMTTKPR